MIAIAEAFKIVAGSENFFRSSSRMQKDEPDALNMGLEDDGIRPVVSLRSTEGNEIPEEAFGGVPVGGTI